MVISNNYSNNIFGYYSSGNFISRAPRAIRTADHEKLDRRDDCGPGHSPAEHDTLLSEWCGWTSDGFVEGKLMVVIRLTLQNSWKFPVSSFWCSCYFAFCISRFIYEWSTHWSDSGPFLELRNHSLLHLGMAFAQGEPMCWTLEPYWSSDCVQFGFSGFTHNPRPWGLKQIDQQFWTPGALEICMNAYAQLHVRAPWLNSKAWLGISVCKLTPDLGDVQPRRILVNRVIANLAALNSFL